MKTPHSMAEIAAALWYAHQDVIGGLCPIALLDILAAHVAFETADGKAINGENPGNVRGHGDAGSIAIKGADEIVNGHRVTGPEVESGFAAYSSLREGCRAYVRYLGVATHPPKPNRYAAAWEAANRGDLAGFVKGIRHPDDGGAGVLCKGCGRVHMGGYFTADEGLYLRGCQRKLEDVADAAVSAFIDNLQVPGEPQ